MTRKKVAITRPKPKLNALANLHHLRQRQVNFWISGLHVRKAADPPRKLVSGNCIASLLRHGTDVGQRPKNSVHLLFALIAIGR
jgi:hypothetical protein